MNLRKILITTALLAPLAAVAHGPVPRKNEAVEGQARLFTSDSATGQVVVVDLPGGEVAARLATPPYILTMGLSNDSRHVFAMRGRDTERDTVTVIDTGVEGGQVRFPSIVRTFTGNAPGGVRDGRLASVGGRDAIFNEGVGEIQVFESGDFGSLEAVKTRVIKLAAPDHYHYQEAGDHLYVGHLAKGMVLILERATGKEVGRIPGCPVLHGMARDDVSGRLFFACMPNVVVVGTRGAEQHKEVTRIPYPGTQRIGIFIRGKDRVVWGGTEGANPAIHRLDMGVEPYAFQSIPVDSAIQRGITDDGEFLLIYSRNGTLDIRDGGTGELLHKVKISDAFDSEYHEHVDKALLPDIVAIGHTGYVSIPPEGVIAEVDLVAGKLLRRIDVGGQPTRLLAVEAKPAAASAAAAE
jgi:hypothetical protein